MGVFDKLKNVFFEEEYVEVEEPIRKQKKEKPAIAKKIDLPEMPKIKDEKTSREKEIEDEVVEKIEQKGITERDLRKNDTFKFPITFEDEDFKEETHKPDKKENVYQEHIEKPKYSFDYKKEEQSKKIDYATPGLYEGGIEYKKEQKVFRPTPIISPIYGVLDKNYKKEEIVQKKEVRLSSSASSRKVDLDTIREKAYGDLASDITASMMDNNEENESNDNIMNDTSLYDLNDNESPVVTKVTVGDAEEYYNDLGLEYNIDYKDNAKEKATGRRTQKPLEEDDDSEVENNLFDLIDSMYSDSEKE